MSQYEYETFTADAGAAPAAESRYIKGEEVFYPPPTAGTAGMVVNPRTAIKLPTLLSVVNVLATDVAMIPLRVYRRLADGGRDLDASHVVDDLLNVSPDGETTAITWRQALMAHAVLTGNGLAEIVRRGPRPASLHLMDPDDVSIVRAGRSLEYRLANGKRLAPSSVFHLAGLGYDGVSGWSFVELIEQAIGVGLAAEAFQGDFFSNGSDPGGVIQLAKTLSPDKRKELARDWQGRHKGPGKRHGVAVLEDGATYNPTTVDPSKSQLIEARKHQNLETSRPWRLPPQKTGDYSQSHLANLGESNQDYLNTALMPWLIAWEQQAALKLFSAPERRAGVYVEHIVEAMLRGDLLKRYQAYEIAIRNGWMNRDEVRRRENMSPIGKPGGGLKFTVQLNLTDLSRVGEDGSNLAPPASPIGDASTPGATTPDENPGRP